MRRLERANVLDGRGDAADRLHRLVKEEEKDL
jgi:hypothetical protein